MVGVPIDLKQAIHAKAKAGKLSTPAFILLTLAESVGYTGPLTQPRTKKYANDEERKAARKGKSELMRRLLKEHEPP